KRSGVMDMKTFAEFWKGMFFFVSTVTVSVLLYLVVIVWQPLWTDGFRNFGDISKAIIRLDRTAKPVAEMAPLMLGEMDEMRETMVKMQLSMETIEEMNPSVKEITHTMNRMTWVIEQRMGIMTNEMDRMGDRFSPSGMMPFNW
ncbi:MAG: hypothetical protein ACR2O5_03335, partial [Thiogranum sp.]